MKSHPSTLRPIMLLVCLAFIATYSWSAQAKDSLEDFHAKNFERPTVIDNQWYPLKPGMKYIWDGYAVDEEGEEEPHSTVCVVTDLVKQIAGVDTVVCWERDFVDKEMEEAEIMFLAQDNHGNVWLLGEYPEEYDNGKYLKNSAWIHGCKDGRRHYHEKGTEAGHKLFRGLGAVSRLH